MTMLQLRRSSDTLAKFFRSASEDMQLNNKLLGCSQLHQCALKALQENKKCACVMLISALLPNPEIHQCDSMQRFPGCNCPTPIARMLQDSHYIH